MKNIYPKKIDDILDTNKYVRSLIKKELLPHYKKYFFLSLYFQFFLKFINCKY